VHEPQKDQQDHCAERGVDDSGDNTGTKVNPQLRHQPAADEGADNANNNIADETEAAALYDLSRQPTRDQADQKYDEKTFTRHMHGPFSFVIAVRADNARGKQQPVFSLDVRQGTV
jgi:hypothetical protein